MEKRADTGDISVLFFLSCANFLAVYAQTDYKHCAVLYCAKSNQLKTLCYLHCGISTVLLALCYQHFAISTVQLALCYQNHAISTVLKVVCYYAVLAKLGLIQGNSRCFGANCKMAQNTRFLCYYFGLKYSSVLFFTIIPSLMMTSFVDLTNICISKEILETLTSQDWVAVAIDSPQHLWVILIAITMIMIQMMMRRKTVISPVGALYIIPSIFGMIMILPAPTSQHREQGSWWGSSVKV